MATITFLWHLHQPAYRTADGTAHAPWVAVHAGGSYTTLARAILETGAHGQVINLVPTLIEQMEAYRDGRVHDTVVEVLCRPTSELDDDAVLTLLEWGLHVTPRQRDRYPRLAELAARRASMHNLGRYRTIFGRGDLRDLQVLFILAQSGAQAWLDPELKPLREKGRNYDSEDHAAASAWFYAQPKRALELWSRLAGADGVEISTSPYAHPIMPLLVDTAVVRESWAPAPPPQAPAFHHPEDARRQLAEALSFMRKRGFHTAGCWPPEGSVSPEVAGIYAEAGIGWLVTDEGILERSLGRELRADGRLPEEIYRPWRIEAPSPTLFFRDRLLSDRIGFIYGRWENEDRAADDLIDHLDALARKLPREAAIVLALDGENPWLHYLHGGDRFLRRLAGNIEASPTLEPATLSELTGRSEPQRLERIHPGSWIGGTFSTWIGHPEKSHGWKILAEVRDLVSQSGKLPRSMLLAEGSDWFWWLGDDNPSPLAPLYDRIFRRHLSDACMQAGVPAPEMLRRPLKVRAEPVRVPISRRWKKPVFDGRITTYFEWSLATWVDLPGDSGLSRLGLWGDGENLNLLIEGGRAMESILLTQELRVRLAGPRAEMIDVRLGRDSENPRDERAAVDQVVEVAIPWEGEPGWRLEIELGARRYPEDSVLVLTPFEVDEEA